MVEMLWPIGDDWITIFEGDSRRFKLTKNKLVWFFGKQITMISKGGYQWLVKMAHDDHDPTGFFRHPEVV